MSKRIFSLIAKGILLWVTTINFILFIVTLDLLDGVDILVWLMVSYLLVLLCTRFITLEEFKLLTLNTYFSKRFPNTFSDEEEGKDND